MFILGLVTALMASPWTFGRDFDSLNVQELGELAGKTTDLVLEIRAARILAQQHGADLVTYGGTSREILVFMRKKMHELGGVDAYRQWVESRPRLHLFDWHRIQSDLDLMLIAKDAQSNVKSKPDYSKVIAGIQKELPGNIFFKNLDIQIAADFLKDPRFRPQLEHFEAISNIPIGPQGFVFLSELQAQVDGKPMNLAEWGVKQFQKRELDFRLNPEFKNQNAVFAKLKQVLRWLRYGSEYPDMHLSATSQSAIRSLLQDIRQNHLKEALAFLKTGHEELQYYGAKATTASGKIVEALEKAQLYSGGSLHTRRLLDEYGVTTLAKEAGVAKYRIFDPLPEGKAIASGAAAEVFLHRTSLAAAQSMANGALWISNGTMFIQGKSSTAVLGPGLYCAKGADQLSFGDVAIALEVEPSAAKNYDGRLVLKDRAQIRAVLPLTLDTLFFTFERQLEDPTLSKEEHASVARALASLLNPETDPQDIERFRVLLEKTQTVDVTDAFLGSYMRKPSTIRAIFGGGASARRMNFLSEALNHSSHAEFAIQALEAALRDSSLESLIKEVPTLKSYRQVTERALPASAGFIRDLPEFVAKAETLPEQLILTATLEAWTKHALDFGPGDRLSLWDEGAETYRSREREHAVYLQRVKGVLGKWGDETLLQLESLLAHPDRRVQSFALAHLLRKKKNWKPSTWIAVEQVFYRNQNNLGKLADILPDIGIRDNPRVQGANASDVARWDDAYWDFLGATGDRVQLADIPQASHHPGYWRQVFQQLADEGGVFSVHVVGGKARFQALVLEELSSKKNMPEPPVNVWKVVNSLLNNRGTDVQSGAMKFVTARPTLPEDVWANLHSVLKAKMEKMLEARREWSETKNRWYKERWGMEASQLVQLADVLKQKNDLPVETRDLLRSWKFRRAVAFQLDDWGKPIKRRYLPPEGPGFFRRCLAKVLKKKP